MWLIFAAFVAALALLIFSGQQSEPTKNFVTALLFFATALTQLWINQPITFLRSSRLLLVFGVIFVQLAASDIPWDGPEVANSSFGDSVQLLEAVRYIFDEAGDKPCVVNLSLGTNGGPHDGTTVAGAGAFP